MAEQRTKRPASQYYWGDWWKDKGLHSCSLTARGLWHEMNCLMHEGDPYGHLTLNGRPMTNAQLANQCRISPAQCTKLLKELEDAGVFSRDTGLGTIFSRRMVRDEATRNARAEGGKAGAEHGAKGAEHGAKGGRPSKQKGGEETPLGDSKNPPPSSSSSSSTSASLSSVPFGTGAEAPAPGPNPPAEPPVPPAPPAPPPAPEPPAPPAPTRARTAADEEKSRLWAALKTSLVEQSTCKDLKAAGVLLGKAARDYGEKVFLEAARATVEAKPGNTHTYLIGLCEHAAGKRQALNRQVQLEDTNLAAAAAFAGG